MFFYSLPDSYTGESGDKNTCWMTLLEPSVNLLIRNSGYLPDDREKLSPFIFSCRISHEKWKLFEALRFVLSIKKIS